MLFHNVQKNIFFKATLVFSLVAFFSCKDELTTNPFETATNGLIGTIDTFTIYGNTVIDTMGYKAHKLPLAPVGMLEDAEFGKTQASVFSNFELPSNEINLGVATYDSLILTLSSGSSYGPISGPVDLEVYEVNTLIENKVYDLINNLDYNATPIGVLNNYKPNYSDSVPVLGVNTSPHIRIKLSDILGQSFMNQTATSGFKDNINFQNFFKGVYLKVNGVNSGLIYINFLGPLSKLTLFYKVAGEQKTMDFKILNNSNYVSRFTHNYPAAITINSKNPQGDNSMYLEGLAGLKAKIFIPYIKNLSNIALIKAEIVATVENAPFPLPRKLHINKEDSFGNILDLHDFFLPSFNARYQSNLVNGKIVYQYRINITRHLQKVINNEINNYPLFLYANEASIINDNLVYLNYLFRGSRIKIGGNNPGSKLKLEISYLK